MNSKIILSVLIIASAFLHLERIAVPSQPVFDEMYYTTHASRYAQGEPHFDTHPPLGKLLYAIPLFFLKGERTTDAAFIETVYDKTENKIKPKVHFEPYRDFPYVPLRLISAVFGILLPLIVYFFIRAVSASEVAALLGAFFITFENALLLESRLILLNPMFLVFGLASLIFMMRGKPKPLIGGILFGLAMSVKWTAIVFIGPLVMLFLFSRKGDPISQTRGSTSKTLTSKNREEVEPRNIESISQWSMINGKQFVIFLAIAIIIFLIIQIGIQNLIVPAGERVELYESLIPWLAPSSEHGSIFFAAKAFLVETIVMVTGYTSGIAWDPELSSKWFLWPFIGTPMTYSRNPLIILIGNPFVWFAGTAAVVMALWKILSILWNPFVNGQWSTVKSQPRLIFFGSYLFALLPFVLVSRATFLYHYFPALIFSICLAALLFKDVIQKPIGQWSIVNSQKLIVIILLTLIGFALSAPYTYGLIK